MRTLQRLDATIRRKYTWTPTCEMESKLQYSEIMSTSRDRYIILCHLTYSLSRRRYPEYIEILCIAASFHLPFIRKNSAIIDIQQKCPYGQRPKLERARSNEPQKLVSEPLAVQNFVWAVRSTKTFPLYEFSCVSISDWICRLNRFWLLDAKSSGECEEKWTNQNQTWWNDPVVAPLYMGHNVCSWPQWGNFFFR